MTRVDVHEDLLGALTPARRAHSLAVGPEVDAVASRVPAALRSGLVAAAVLHDVGYAHPGTGSHPLDGARSLRGEGFSRRVCHLVVHHSASTWEAEERGLSLDGYADFAVEDVDLGPAHAVLWWADVTTGPRGQDVTVEERLEEIQTWYGPDDPVNGSPDGLARCCWRQVSRRSGRSACRAEPVSTRGEQARPQRVVEQAAA